MISLHLKFTAILLYLLSPAIGNAAGTSQLVTNLEAGKNQVVVTYGTSLTERGAWVGQMKNALDKLYPGQLTLINSGGSGQWSEWGVKNLDERVIAKTPDTVFIEFCINDSVARFKGSPEIARKNLVNMIERIQKALPECEIILMTMTPGDKHPEGHRSYRKNITAYYAMYREEAAKRGLLLIDHYPNWITLQKSDPQLFEKYVPDSIHPTAEGNEKIVTPVILRALGANSDE